MSAKMSRLLWGTLLGSLLLATVVMSHSRAQNRVSRTPDQLIPAESILYVRWDGSAAHADAFSKTAAHEALYESGLMPLIEKAIKGVIAQSPAAGAMDGPVGQFLEHVRNNGVSLGVALAPPQENGPPIPLPFAVAVLPDGGQFSAPIGQMLQGAARAELKTQEINGREIQSMVIPDTPGIELGWWPEGDHLMIAAGLNAFSTAVGVASGDLPNVTSNPLWEEFGPESAGFEISGLSWFDFGKLRDTFGAMPVPLPIPRPEGPLTVNDIARVAGFDNMGAVISQTGYKGRTLWSETTLQVEGEKRGLLALGDQQSITWEQLPPLPADSKAIVAGSFSLSKFYTDLLAIVGDVSQFGPPEVQQQAQQGIAMVPQILGFDPKADLFDALGNVVSFYLDSNQDFFGIGGVALIAEVKDAEKLKRTLDHIILMAEGASNGEFAAIRSEKHGRQILTFEVEGFEFGGIAVDEKWMIVGLMPQTVEAALLRIDGKIESFEPSRELLAALGDMPKEFTGITVTDPRQIYTALMGYAPLVFSGAQAALRNSGEFPPDFELPVKLVDVPPSEIVTRPLFVNVMASESTEKGFRWTSRSSLPAIPFFGGGGSIGSVGTIGVMTALLLPAVQQARTAARRTSSKNNLKQIAIALHNYHDVYRSFPSGTIEESADEVKDRLSWMVSILPFVDQAALYDQIDRKQGWDSDANSDWTSLVIQAFLNPNEPPTGEGETHYVGMAGIGEDAPNLDVKSPRAGVFGYNRKTRMRDILDGTSNTIGVTESSDEYGPWAAGGRPTIRALTEEPYINGPDGIGSSFPGGLNVMMMDGSVRFVSENIDPEVFKALITIRGGERIGNF